MRKYLLKQINIVNENKIEQKDIYLKQGRIERIDNNFGVKEKVIEINGEGKHLFPGLIDDQVHFREPGLTHKATMYSESKAAVAGGVTSFMEMPNTIPNALTVELLEEKYAIANKNSLANYSFYMGVSNTNAAEVLKINQKKNEVCGIKIFMGSSTGNMLVDNEPALHKIFSESEMLIATHCEDEKIIKANYAKYKNDHPNLSPRDHPLIRDENACYTSSSFAISLAKKYNSRLHVLHITTAKEIALFSNNIPLKEKRITSEVCVHHLHFTADDYEKLGYLIKCNPAIKEGTNKEALWKALLDNHLDVIATDHAPHTWEEKLPPYENALSGLPLVQHPLLLLLHYYKEGKISLEKIAEKTSHAVADCFKIKNRGFIREGYFADLVLVNLNRSSAVNKNNILYKCGWSPLDEITFPAAIEKTFVNGNCVFQEDDYGNSVWDESSKGERLFFGD